MAEAAAKPKLRQPLDVVYEDGRQEQVVIKRLSNTDLITWIDRGFNKTFLVFRAIERAAKEDRADQAWFDTLEQSSAMAVVEKALELNYSADLQKKILGPAAELLRSFLSAMPSNSSSAAGTASNT